MGCAECGGQSKLLDSVEAQEILFTKDLDAVCGAGCAAGGSSKERHYRDGMETVGEQLFVPRSPAWTEAVERAAKAMAVEPDGSARVAILKKVLTLSSKLADPPDCTASIVAQLRPCVSAQVTAKLEDLDVVKDLGHDRAQPAVVHKLQEGDCIGSVAVAYTEESALRFGEALKNTPQPLSSRNLSRAPSETDQQIDTDFDAFCFPPLEDDPEFEQKWFRKTVTEVAASLHLFPKAAACWRKLCNEKFVKGIFAYSIENMRLANLRGVQDVHLTLRGNAQDRFDPQRSYSVEDIDFAGPVEQGLLKAGLLVPLVLGPGEKLHYISQPLIPKSVQEDGLIKRRYAVDFKPTVNVDLQVPKATQWDTRDWHFADQNVVLRSVLDGKMWYFQYPMDRESQLLTAQNLISKAGLFVSAGLQLGLAPAPAECIKRNAVLFFKMGRDELWSAMDELICMSRGTEMTEAMQLHHIDVLERLFRILHEHRAKCSVEKVQFFQQETRLMGMEHRVGELRIPAGKLDSVASWPFPKGRNVRKQLMSNLAGWQWLASQDTVQYSTVHTGHRVRSKRCTVNNSTH
jgi:hypothetical protein